MRRKYGSPLALGVLLSLGATSVVGQTRLELKGCIVDTASVAIMGATVTESQVKTAAMSDRDGYFRLPLPAGAHVLEVSCMGYVSQSIPLALSKATSSLRVVLTPSEEAIEAVRVVAKGQAQRMREHPLSVAVLDQKLLEHPWSCSKRP